MNSNIYILKFRLGVNGSLVISAAPPKHSIFGRSRVGHMCGSSHKGIILSSVRSLICMRQLG